jgi:spore germination protein GerM
VFFVRKERLVPVKRRIDSAHPVAQAVEALLNGVTDQEAANGLRSAIGSGVSLHTIPRADDGHVTVDLGDALTAVGGSEQALAVAQIVYTVTQVDDGRPVQILLDGARVQVARPDGTLTGRPLTRADYEALGPPSRRRPS